MLDESNAPKVGNVIPNFITSSLRKERWELEEEVKDGPIVLQFYLGDFGTLCSRNIIQAMEFVPELERLGVRWFPVSTNNLQSHRSFKVRLGVPFDFLADPEHEVVRIFGLDLKGTAWGDISARGVFVIGTDRVLHHADAPEDVYSPYDLDAVMDSLRRLQDGV